MPRPVWWPERDAPAIRVSALQKAPPPGRCARRGSSANGPRSRRQRHVRRAGQPLQGVRSSLQRTLRSVGEPLRAAVQDHCAARGHPYPSSRPAGRTPLRFGATYGSGRHGSSGRGVPRCDARGSDRTASRPLLRGSIPFPPARPCLRKCRARADQRRAHRRSTDGSG